MTSHEPPAGSSATSGSTTNNNTLIPLPVRLAPRQRKWAPKVRTGCTTCRTRHVKCDEAKPECKRCTSTGRQCQGQQYGIPSDTQFKRIVLRPKPGNILALTSQPGYAVSPSGVASSDEDMIMFHFFRTEAATHLAGAFDQEFCTMGLLQASNLHPAVWHACTALAAMYQRESISSKMATEAEQQRFYVMALKQYDASIKSIVDLIGSSESDTKHEILLTSCLLFTAICCLQGCLTTALVHLRNGQRLYHQWKSETRRKESQDHHPSSNLINVKALIALLSRLCTQAIDLRDSHWDEWDIEGLDLVEPSPEPFTSPADAYLEFEPICNAFMELRHRRKSALAYGQVGPAEELRHAYQKVLAAWTTKFYHLKASRAFSPNEFEGMLILEARYLSFYIELHRDPDSEMHWDTFQPQFARIVSLAESVFQISGQPGPSNQQMPRTLATRAFSFSSSVMDSIFSVTRYCRHYATRHRALYLLQNCCVKDGICDTKLASGLAAGLMGVEERPGQMNCLLDGEPDCRCDGFYICGEHRITVLDGELVEDGKVALMAKTARDVRLGLPGTFVPVSW